MSVASPGAITGRVSPPSLNIRSSSRIIYTTNAIESLHSQMRKNISTRKVFPNDDAVIKILFLEHPQLLQSLVRNVKDGI